MQRYFFSGVVLPERAVMSVHDVHLSAYDNRGQELHAVLNNQISIRIDTEETDPLTLRNYARAEAEFFVNVAGFPMGHGYDVEVTKVFDQDLSVTHVFGIEIPVVAARAAGGDFNAAVNGIIPLCFGELGVFLRRALADLSFALKRLDDTPFYCFRGIESLRHSFGYEQQLSSESEQWKAMAAAIGGSKTELEPLRAGRSPRGMAWVRHKRARREATYPC
jgi:hypothetical protein